MTRRLWLISLCASLLIGPIARAAADDDAAADGAADRAAAVDRLVTPLIDGGWCEGLVVGVLDDTGPRTYGYGRFSKANAAEPNGDTLFEIGSMTKALTGTLLADMVKRGEVALDDPVQKYLPDSVKL